MNKQALKQEMIGRAREIAQEIKLVARETEIARKPLDSVIKRLDEAGLFTILMPERWGGPELDVRTQYEVVEAVSAACMSTGWITAFYIGHHPMICRFSERAQAEVFVDGPRCLLPGTTSPTMKVRNVSGGWELTGKAPWGSGIMHADWVIVGGMADDGARLFLIPASDVSYDDVWHMAGMAGTGSNDIVVNGVFVPQHRSEPHMPFMDGSKATIHANPMYSMPLLPFIYTEVIGVFAGGLRGASEEFDAIIRKRVTTHQGQVVRDRSNSHIQLGQSEVFKMASHELALGIVSRVQNHLDNGGFTLSDRLELKALAGFTVDHCRRAVNDMINRAGAGSFSHATHLQRIFRDINMVAIHAFWDWETAYEQLGRHHLGLEPNTPLV